MTKFLQSALVGVLISLTAMAELSPDVMVERDGLMTRLKVKGSLDKSFDLPCISLAEARNVYTPPDLFSSSAKCVLEGRDKDAAQLFFLANAYGFYDGKRVSDATAGQATMVLAMNNFNPIEGSKKEGLQIEIEKISSRSSPEIDEFCAGITSVGKPDYHPQYMILHGIDAFSGIEGDGLKPVYDANGNWVEVLKPLCP